MISSTLPVQGSLEPHHFVLAELDKEHLVEAYFYLLHPNGIEDLGFVCTQRAFILKVYSLAFIESLYGNP